MTARFEMTPDGKFRETSVGAYLTDEQNSTGFAGDQEIPHRPRVGEGVSRFQGRRGLPVAYNHSSTDAGSMVTAAKRPLLPGAAPERA